MHLKLNLIKILKLIGVDIRQALVGLIVIGLVAAYGGLLYISKALLNCTIQFLTIPTPLWATIVLVLLCIGYIYLKTKKQNQAFLDKPPYLIREIITGGLKWKIKIYPDYRYEVEKIPMCQKHDYLLVYESSYHICPEVRDSNCDIKIHVDDLPTIYETAISYIDKTMRNIK